jgi:transcriptional regulator of acetoin/glycerol metabolism
MRPDLVVTPESELIGLGDPPADMLGRAAQASEELSLNHAMERTERPLLLEARQRHGNQAQMAKALGVDQSTIARKMKKHGIP